MTKRILAIGLDAFGTALQETMHFESPYKTLIADIFPKQVQGPAHKELRRQILTDAVALEDVPRTAERFGLFIDNGINIGAAIVGAETLLDAQLREGAFKRNPDVDTIKSVANENGLHMGIISDLAAPYGVIVTHHLSDIRPHSYSYRSHSIKEDGTPFDLFAEKLNVSLDQIVYVGNNLESDYLTPHDKGMAAFWYVPNKKARHMEKHAKAIDMYQDDIISSLPEMFEKLSARGYTLG